MVRTSPMPAVNFQLWKKDGPPDSFVICRSPGDAGLPGFPIFAPHAVHVGLSAGFFWPQSGHVFEDVEETVSATSLPHEGQNRSVVSRSVPQDVHRGEGFINETLQTGGLLPLEIFVYG